MLYVSWLSYAGGLSRLPCATFTTEPHRHASANGCSAPAHTPAGHLNVTWLKQCVCNGISLSYNLLEKPFMLYPQIQLRSLVKVRTATHGSFQLNTTENLSSHLQLVEPPQYRHVIYNVYTALQEHKVLCRTPPKCKCNCHARRGPHNDFINQRQNADLCQDP